MSDTISPPADWRPFCLTLSRGANGLLEGALTITQPDGSHRSFGVANWEKAGDGIIRGHMTVRGSDPWLEEWMARLERKVSA